MRLIRHKTFKSFFFLGLLPLFLAVLFFSILPFFFCSSLMSSRNKHISPQFSRESPARRGTNEKMPRFSCRFVNLPARCFSPRSLLMSSWNKQLSRPFPDVWQ